MLACLTALGVAIGVGLAVLLLNSAYAAALLVLIACLGGLVTWPHDDTPRTPANDPWWAIPTRMGLVTIMVCGIAALEPFLGTGLAGTFASLPMILVVMGLTEHRARGLLGAVDLAGGTLASIAGTAAFLLAVVVLTPLAGLWVALAAGLLVIPVVNRAATALAVDRAAPGTAAEALAHLAPADLAPADLAPRSAAPVCEDSRRSVARRDPAETTPIRRR